MHQLININIYIKIHGAKIKTVRYKFRKKEHSDTSMTAVFISKTRLHGNMEFRPSDVLLATCYGTPSHPISGYLNRYRLTSPFSVLREHFDT